MNCAQPFLGRCVAEVADFNLPLSQRYNYEVLVSTFVRQINKQNERDRAKPSKNTVPARSSAQFTVQTEQLYASESGAHCMQVIKSNQ